ncbi:IclR family transcriptional regulator [Nocardioides sp. J9]|uniref:IclR family transcriptional regulator n=1 Tax=unclassified Nocardioides TaxID=2615069 RepID=UPI000491B5E5|nr:MULTISPECIES: IclR family transcriptional regulator [unclassified Nocardioides]TWH04711.1 IclR family transcriptional regulator [Nocardioides sp. J9]
MAQQATSTSNGRAGGAGTTSTTSTGTGGAAAGPVKSAARALDLLDEIAANGPGTQLQLSTRLSIPKSSLHALLRTMTDRGWLQTDPTGSIYQLGIRSLVVSSAYLSGDPVLARAQGIMDEIASATEETVNLGRLAGADVIYTAKRESLHPLRMHTPVGRRLPAYSTALGRAILAEHSREAREALVPDEIAAFTAKTVTDRDAVLTIIDDAERLGYASESDESCIGVRCFGVALPFARPVQDGISVAVPISRLTPEREDHIVETLLSIRARLSAEHDNSFVR